MLLNKTKKKPRGFANGPGDRTSNQGQVISQSQKNVLGASLLNTQIYKVRIKGEWSNLEKGVVPSPP